MLRLVVFLLVTQVTPQEEQRNLERMMRTTPAEDAYWRQGSPAWQALLARKAHKQPPNERSKQ